MLPEEKIEKRDTKTGRFVAGNGTGGRKKMPEELKKAFQAAAPEALAALKEILATGKPSDRIRAAEVILDRGYGKPAQAVDVESSIIPQVVFIGDVPD